jgi:drug/metabolite transporter (DMT)-like permease
VQHPSALWLSIPAELGVGVGATAGLLFLIAVCATLGHGLLILGYARAPVATLTPYLYAQIPFSVLAGWLIFRHQPDSWTLCGIVIVAISGVFGTWLTARERQLDVRLAV